MDTQSLVIQLRYSAWATKCVLESTASVPPEQLTRDLGNSFGSLYGTLTHIFQADSIWFDRLMGNPTSGLSAYDPPPQLPALSKAWSAVLEKYVFWAEKLDAGGWDRVVAYRDTKGNAYESPVWQIVLHLVNHASYHRGQIATMLRQLGHTPAGTDLIAYYRSEAAHA